MGRERLNIQRSRYSLRRERKCRSFVHPHAKLLVCGNHIYCISINHTGSRPPTGFLCYHLFIALDICCPIFRMFYRTQTLSTGTRIDPRALLLQLCYEAKAHTKTKTSINTSKEMERPNISSTDARESKKSWVKDLSNTYDSRSKFELILKADSLTIQVLNLQDHIAEQHTNIEMLLTRLQDQERIIKQYYKRYGRIKSE